MGLTIHLAKISGFIGTYGGVGTLRGPAMDTRLPITYETTSKKPMPRRASPIQAMVQSTRLSIRAVGAVNSVAPRPDQTVRQQFGQPHRIVDVGLAARHVLHMRGVR